MVPDLILEICAELSSEIRKHVINGMAIIKRDFFILLIGIKSQI
jgi:hypothetical protein